MIWLGEHRGMLSDWTTQQWVRATGRRISLLDHPWLDGPTGDTRRIGHDFFARYAQNTGLALAEPSGAGLLDNFAALASSTCPIASVSPPVQHFYEHTSLYELDAWSAWQPLFRPFGHLLAILFSRRLQQLNIPLSPLDSSRGMSSRVLQLRDPHSGHLTLAAWVRKLHATGNVLYAGAYSLTAVPGHTGLLVRVVFPLPNGNAIVLMRPEVHPDGSFSVTSAGRTFGDPGFYFTVHNTAGAVWARYVHTMQETIHVFAAEPGIVRADHRLRIFGTEFLQLHYRMREIHSPQPPHATLPQVGRA